jgi:hypothetical protein
MSVSTFILLRKGVDVLEQASGIAFRAARGGIDWLEQTRRPSTPKPTAADTSVVKAPRDGPLNTDDLVDETGAASFPASDPPASN